MLDVVLRVVDQDLLDQVRVGNQQNPAGTETETGDVAVLASDIKEKAKPLIGKLVPFVTPTPTRGYMMGNVAVPTPTPKTTPSPVQPMMGAVALPPQKRDQPKEQPKTKPSSSLSAEEKALIEKALGKLSS